MEHLSLPLGLGLESTPSESTAYEDTEKAE